MPATNPLAKLVVWLAAPAIVFLPACGSGPSAAIPTPTPSAGRIAATPSSANGLPANGRIAVTLEFGSKGHFTNSSIFTIEPNGTGMRMLTNGATGNDADPAWSPTGDRIVFDVHLPLGSGESDATSSNVVSMDSTGGSVRQLTFEPTGVFDGDPVISPDGTRIAFERFDLNGRLTGIYLMHADGSNITRVTTPPASAAGGDQHPDFSPDGAKLVFDRDGTDNGDGAIDIIGIDGKGFRQVTPASVDATRPRWSPDGSKLVFANPDTTSPAVGRNVYVVNTDGTSLTVLTHVSAPDYAGAPSWSPDGTMIVYFVYHAGTNYIGLAVMHADGSHPIVIWHPTPKTDIFVWTSAWGTAS